MLRDIRYAARSLSRSPGFACAAILTFALGIGANTAIYSVLHAVVLAPLPYTEPDRLVQVLLFNTALNHPTYCSYPDFVDWQRQSRSFQQIAAYTGQGVDLTNPGPAEHLKGKEVTAGFFGVLGVKPALGREFSPEEDRFGGAPAAMISHKLWDERFARNPSAIGKAITLNGIDYTVVGVLPRDFRLPGEDADAYTALGHDDPFVRNDRTNHDVAAIARLAPRLTVGQAQAELNTVQEQIDRLNPQTERGLKTYIEPLKESIVGDVSKTLVLLFAAVGLVLLIACCNVANLLLARGTSRAREFSLRLALGANRTQVMRYVVTEGALLSLAGGTLGLAFAGWGMKAIRLAFGESLPRAEQIALDIPVLCFVVAVSLFVGIAFALVPAWQSSRVDLQASIRRHPVQNSFVILQVALSLILLTGASLLLRTIHNLWTVNPGFEAQHVLTFQVGLSSSVSKTAPQIRSTFRQLVERIRQIPGVRAADLTALVPMGAKYNEGPFWLGIRQPASMAEIPRAIYYPIGPDYPRTMKIPLLRGRALSRSDDTKSERVILIDSLLAQQYFGGGNPVGQTITVPHWGLARVVGVIGHVKQYGLDSAQAEKPQIYYSFYQLNDEWVPAFSSDVSIAVRSANSATIRNAITDAAGGQPVYNVHAIEDLVSHSMDAQRLPMLLLSAFALLALALAFIGIYGVISYSTNQRAPEFAIRSALGAASWNVLRIVIGQGLKLSLIGIAAGTAAALIILRLLSSYSRLLFGVSVNDPVTLLGVSFVLLIAAMLACYLPARRAAQSDPMAVLRHE
ncbi:MAG TPA: ABC transporter permease [Bryobacteraceae bacterium]|nr:ABC transporter permease [Bryobacteraceae bacterium]